MHLFLEFSNLFTRIPYFILNFKKIHGNTFLRYITELFYIYIYIYIYIENKAFTTSDKSRSNTWLARVVPQRKGTYITHCKDKCKPKPAPCHPNRNKCKLRFHKKRFPVTKVQKYNNLKYRPKSTNQTRVQEEQEDLPHNKNGKTLYSDILKRKQSKTDIERKSSNTKISTTTQHKTKIEQLKTLNIKNNKGKPPSRSN